MQIKDYQCEECGATAASKTTDTCDVCVMKFFTDDPGCYMVINSGKTRPDWRVSA